MIHSDGKILRTGATTKYHGREVTFTGERDNLDPKPCYRCRHQNDGDHVYVLEAIGARGDEAKSLFWCRECVANMFGSFDVVRDPIADDQGDS